MRWRGGLGSELRVSTAPAGGYEFVVLKKLLVMEESGLLREEERKVFDAGRQRSGRGIRLRARTNTTRRRGASW